MKTKLNYLIDSVMYALMAVVIFTGLLQGFVLSEGPVSDASTKYLWGLHRHQWGDIHLVLSLGFCVSLVLHLVLHWSWIAGATRKLLGSRWSLAGILALPVIVIFLAWTWSEQDSPAYAGYGTGGGRAIRERMVDPPAIADASSVGKAVDVHGRVPAAKPAEGPKPTKTVVRGSMTLADIERLTGVPGRKIASKLGMPDNAPLDQTLGRLRRQYGFEVEQVRDLVTDLSGGRIEAIDSEGADHSNEVRPRQPAGRASLRPRREPVNGQMSLVDLQRQTGIPARAIAERLGMGSNPPVNEGLGRLRRRYGFSMHDVRAAVEELEAR